jgi:hypothetical protein
MEAIIRRSPSGPRVQGSIEVAQNGTLIGVADRLNFTGPGVLPITIDPQGDATIPVTGGGGGAGITPQPASPALTTTGDDQPATAAPIASAPSAGVIVTVNGQSAQVSYGTKTAAAYFSGDGGATARALGAVQAGDLLYWRQSFAGFALAPTDTIQLFY